MAEMQSSKAVAPNHDSSLITTSLSDRVLDSSGIALTDDAQLVSGSAGVATDRKTFQQAQSRSTRVYQRPTKRRLPAQRDQADVARDSIIDQIMHESQVPLYERSVPQNPPADDEEVDNDAATAEAFKAQLLAEMEAQKRRRPPPSTGASKGTTIQAGPKSGGSRIQREKMKALEEATSSSSRK